MQRSIIKIVLLFPLLVLQKAAGQSCKTNADLDLVPGKYASAAQYPWPAARAEYFKNLSGAADKAMAKMTLEQIESLEQKSHAGFNLTGGNLENYYSTTGYGFLADAKLGQYTFESTLHEFFCLRGQLKRNDEASTILRMYVNGVPINTLSRFISQPFGSSVGEYDFGLQYQDWSNHKPADVNAKLISLFNYLSCSNNALINAMNSGDGYFQDVAESDIKPNSYAKMIYRYWFVRSDDKPLLVTVSRKEYLQSLLEFFGRERLYFPKLVAKLADEHSSGAGQYSTWESDVADKIAVVQKVLSENSSEWLAAPAVINKLEDASQSYRAGKKERTNLNRFWRFYDGVQKSEQLYKFNPACFKSNVASMAAPQIITVAFRFVSMPASLRMLDNFTKSFDFAALRKIVK